MKRNSFHDEIDSEKSIESEEIEMHRDSSDELENLDASDEESGDEDDVIKQEANTPPSSDPDFCEGQDDPYANFTLHHLHLLHSALQTSNLGVSSRILNEINEQYDIDLGDETTLATLSPSQYAKLKKYEKKNTDFLVAAVVNEYPGAIKYLSKIVNRGNVVDPLGSFQKWFGAVVFVIGAIYLFCASYWVIPEGNKDIVAMVIGVIIGQLIMTPMNYIFRSRQDSQAGTVFPTAINTKKK